jgi:hypothetical protein
VAQQAQIGHNHGGVSVERGPHWRWTAPR